MIYSAPTLVDLFAPASNDPYYPTYRPQSLVRESSGLLTNPVPNATFTYSRLEACAAGSAALAIMYAWVRAGVRDKDRIIPSIPFIYYWARYLEATEDEDDGATLNSVLRACRYKGFCEDKLWAADAKTVASDRPDVDVNAAALANGVLQYAMVERDPNILAATIASGVPVLMRIVVNKDASVANGRYKLQPPASDSVSHCVLAVGYNDDTREFTVHDWDSPDPASGQAPKEVYRPLSYDDVKRADVTGDFWVITDVVPPPLSDDATLASASARSTALDELGQERGSHALYGATFATWVQAELDKPPRQWHR